MCLLSFLSHWDSPNIPKSFDDVNIFLDDVQKYFYYFLLTRWDGLIMIKGGDYMNPLSNRLSSCFADSGLSLRELEAKTGIPKSSLQRYMNGASKRISTGRLMVLADVLNVPLSYFLGVADEYLSKENDAAFELALREKFSADPHVDILLEDEEGVDLIKLSLDIRRIFIDDFGVACSIDYAEKLADLLVSAIQGGKFLEFLKSYTEANAQIREAALAVLHTSAR